MDIKKPSNTVTKTPLVPGTTTQASVTVSLHPLILVNISDHYTRSRVQNCPDNKEVIGAIIGKQVGRHLELSNSFELPYTILDDHVVVDVDYFRQREKQYKEVFPDLEYLGWYTIGETPTSDDVRLHKLYFSETNESAILLKLKPEAKAAEQLPIRVYESVIDIENGQVHLQFMEISYLFITEESERIGIDHVARCSLSSQSQMSQVTEHLTAQSGALKMLIPRLRLISEYVKAVKDEKLPKNDQILRDIASFCSALPLAAQNVDFKKEFNMQCNDTLLLSYLGVLTKQCSALSKLVYKMNVVHESRSFGMRSRKTIFM